MRKHGPFFHMPPAAAPEQSPVGDVDRVIRENTALALRLVRRENRELRMKISELSGKVDTLISVATDIKATSDNAHNQIPEDDPEVEALGRRIDEAIAVLQGAPRGVASVDNAPPPVQGTAVDPNAPI